MIGEHLRRAVQHLLELRLIGDIPRGFSVMILWIDTKPTNECWDSTADPAVFDGEYNTKGVALIFVFPTGLDAIGLKEV